MENTVTISLETYNEMLEDNAKLTEQLKAIKKGYKIHIQDSGWFGRAKEYEIWNASESDKKLMDKIFELEKDRIVLQLKLTRLKKMNIFKFIKNKLVKKD